jgi:uncharacterized protein with PIN domain
VNPGLPCPASHAIEAAGVPHPEVEFLLLNGTSGRLESRVSDGDRIAVYPSGSMTSTEPPLRPPLPDPPAFMLDTNLGKLARILRLVGMDASWPGEIGDEALASLASAQGRVLLTRDRRLLRRRAVIHGYAVRELDPLLQAKEVVGRFDLRRHCRPFTRCSSCGGGLRAVPMADIADRLEPLTKLYYDEFWKCGGCGRIYWAGSHMPSLLGLLESLGLQVGRGDGSGMAGEPCGG